MLILGLPLETLLYIGAKSVEIPGDFNVHTHLNKTHIEARLKKLKEGNTIDWATAEAIALGSLLFQGQWFVWLPVYVSVCLSVCLLWVCLFVLFVCLFISLFVILSVRYFVCSLVCLSACLFYNLFRLLL